MKKTFVERIKESNQDFEVINVDDVGLFKIKPDSNTPKNEVLIWIKTEQSRLIRERAAFKEFCKKLLASHPDLKVSDFVDQKTD